MWDYDKTSFKRHYDRASDAKIPHFHHEIRGLNITPLGMSDINPNHLISFSDNHTKPTKKEKEFILSDIVKKYKSKLNKLPSGTQSPTLVKDRISYDLSFRNSHNLTQLRVPLSNKLPLSPEPHKIPHKNIPKLEPLGHNSPKPDHLMPLEKLSAKNKIRKLIESYNIQTNSNNLSETSKKYIILSTEDPHKIRLKGNKIRKSYQMDKNQYVKARVFQESMVKNKKKVHKEAFLETEDVWSSLSSW